MAGSTQLVSRSQTLLFFYMQKVKKSRVWLRETTTQSGPSESGPFESHLLCLVFLDLVLPHLASLSAHGPSAPCLSSPGSSESGPFSSGPLDLVIFGIDIEEVLNKFSQCHPHRL